MGVRRHRRHRVADRFDRRRVGGNPGWAGSHRHHCRRWRGVGRRRACRYARADRSHNQLRGQRSRLGAARVASRGEMGRYGWPTAAMAPSHGWIRRLIVSRPRLRSGRALNHWSSRPVSCGSASRRARPSRRHRREPRAECCGWSRVDFASTDPALNGSNFDLQAQQLYYATCAGLLTLPDLPAPQGTRLVPEVARAMPAVSADGRTYTFIVRPGFRFSPPSGAPVTAATFKHTIERTLGPKLRAYARSFMGDIVGMRAYQAGRTSHLAGVTASGDRLQIRLTAPAPDLPTRLATTPFCAAPDDTPAGPQSQPIPSAGPYYIVPGTRDQLVLARNPNYGGHRPRVPKQIVFSIRRGTAARRQPGRSQPERLPQLRMVRRQPRRCSGLAAPQGSATGRIAQRLEPATSGISSTRGWTWSTSSSIHPVGCLLRRGCVAP